MHSTLAGSAVLLYTSIRLEPPYVTALRCTQAPRAATGKVMKCASTSALGLRPYKHEGRADSKSIYIISACMKR